MERLQKRGILEKARLNKEKRRKVKITYLVGNHQLVGTRRLAGIAAA